MKLHPSIIRQVEEVRDVIRRKHYALATEKSYCGWVQRFGIWLAREVQAGRIAADDTPERKVEGFLTDLAKGRCSATTQNQAFAALLFLYRTVRGVELQNVNALRAKQPQHVRHAPSIAQVKALLEAVKDSPTYPHRLITRLLYGCGLRVSEPLSIRIRDLDLDKARLVIRGAKGAKDRLVNLPPSLLDPIRRQIEAARVVWNRATERGIPTKLPTQLGRKYPQAEHSFQWFWLFPSADDCQDPHSERRVWWHCHPSAVQKAVGKAARAAGLSASISPHHLRHAWATHAHDAGATIRDLQEILGHKSPETTMIYLHPEPERVPSPLERLAL